MYLKSISIVTKVAPKQHNHKFSLFRTYWLVCAVLFQVNSITTIIGDLILNLFFIKNAFDTSVISIIIINTTNITVAITTSMIFSQASVSVDCPRGLTSRCYNFPLSIVIDDFILEVLYSCLSASFSVHHLIPAKR